MASFSSVFLVGFLCICSTTLSRNIQTRSVSQNLYIDNPYKDTGTWGSISLCPDGSFAKAIAVKYRTPGVFEDESAINGVRLYCVDYNTLADTGEVTSSVDDHGDWYGMQNCSSDFITGFRANVLAHETFGDNVAVENIEVDCNYGTEIVPGLPIEVPRVAGSTYNFDLGEWSSFATCRDGLAVCGVETRLDDGLLEDITAMCDLVLFCCEKPSATTTAAKR